MSTFQVQPQTPYDISIGLPGIAGTPTPVVSYAWTYNGTPIGDNSRFVNNYTFPSFPGTLACTITLTNIVGSVSQTVTATIEEVSNLPSLSPVTIRNNAAQTVPISAIANGNAGVVLRVGGPTAPDVNPVSQNANSISYQWRRAASNIAGATGQTYTLVADDEDQTISVVVTATNLDGSTSRTATLTVGDALPNANSHIGSHLPNEISETAYTPDIAFANLMYMAKARWLGGNGTNTNRPITLWENHTGDPFCTADGWPLKNIDGSPLSSSKPAEIWMIGSNDDYRAWSILQLPGEYTESPAGEVQPAPDNIRDKQARFKLNAYWEGSGTVKLLLIANDVPEQQVTFAGPLNEGPWGTGPVNMRMKSWNWNTGNNCRIGQFKLLIEGTDPNDPVRNIILLISDVRYLLSASPLVVGDLIYEGFDHTTYRPYALYPAWVEKNKRMKILRNHGQTKVNHGDNVIYASQTPEQWSSGANGQTRIVRRVGWSHPPNNYGFETGYGPMNRPTHVLHGVSLKAQIEICNQVRSDWWHSHPANAVYAGTRTSEQPDTFAAFGESGSLLVDQDYITNLVPFVAATLAPGLKMYSELANELWNSASNFNWNYGWALRNGERMTAAVEHGGDGGLIKSVATLGAGAYFAGAATDTGNAKAEKLFSYAGAAILAKEMRALMPAGGPEIVATAGAQFGGMSTDQNAIGQAFMRVPKLFRELDAVAIAPYRSPTFDPGIDPPGAEPNSPEADDNLIALGSAEAAWQWLEDFQRQLEPYSSPIGVLDANGVDQLSSTSYWSVGVYRDKKDNQTYPIGYPSFVRWKHLAIDVPYEFTVPGAANPQFYVRKHLWNGAPARRWNLKLVCYEAGNHYIPVKAGARALFAGVAMAQPYRRFMRRYYETLFAPNIKGLTRDPASGTTESEIYRPGMVPNGISQDREPIIDRCVMLSTSTEPNYSKGMFWGLSWFTSQVNSPQYVGVDESIDLGIGTPNWWVGYTGDSE